MTGRLHKNRKKNLNKCAQDKGKTSSNDVNSLVGWRRKAARKQRFDDDDKDCDQRGVSFKLQHNN